MGDYGWIARVYMRGAAMAVWGFTLLSLGMVCAGIGEPASYQGDLHGSDLMRRACIAMFAYFNAGILGILLRDNIAQPWASVLPHFRAKHLSVVAVIALVFLGIPAISTGFLGSSDIAPISMAVIFFACVAAGLWTAHHPFFVLLTLPFLAFVMAPVSSSSELDAFLAGRSPVISAILGSISIAALGAFVWRILVLKEEMPEYQFARLCGDCFRGRGQIFQGQSTAISHNIPLLPIDQRAAFQTPAWPSLTTSKSLENLGGFSERSLWQWVQLWRLGTGPTPTIVSLARLILSTLVIIAPMTWIPPIAGLPSRNIVLIFSVQVMTNPFNLLIWWIMRRPRLGYEFLRPRTRQEFVRELGLALLWDISQCWLGGIFLMAIASAIWAPELLQLNKVVQFVFCTAACQLGLFALGIWFLKRGLAFSILYSVGAFMVIAMWMISTMNGAIGYEVNLAIATAVAVLSLATIPLARRRWLSQDLD